MPKKFDQEAKPCGPPRGRPHSGGEYFDAGSLQDHGTQRGNGRKPARREGRVTERLPEDLVAEAAKLRRDHLPDVKHASRRHLS